MSEERVPVRTILVTIGLVVASGFALYLAVKLAHIWALLLVAVFFAVLLTPPVEWLRARIKISRGMATALVFLLGLLLTAGMLYAFIRPLVDQTQHFIDRFPEYVSDAREGRGAVGRLVRRYELDRRLEENRERVNEALRNAGGSAVSVARRVFAGIVSLLTVLVLAVLMILYGPEILAAALGLLHPHRRRRVQAVAADCARALTGYAMGNLLISLIAGLVTFVALWAFGVPFKGVLALWVGFCDLIPLVGATIGAVPTIFVAFLHSTTAGVGMLIVYIVYQQFENHVLQVGIMSKTVKINQLVVLVSVLIGVELFGFLGALMAIPIAGVVQVIARDVWDHRQGRIKEEPTIGADQVPVSQIIDERPDDLPQERGPEPVPPPVPPAGSPPEPEPQPSGPQADSGRGFEPAPGHPPAPAVDRAPEQEAI